MVVMKWNSPIDRTNKSHRNVYALMAANETDRPKRLAIEPTAHTRWSPQISLYENLNVFEIEALIPGMDPGRLSVTVENCHLVISGDRPRGNHGIEPANATAGARFLRKVKLPRTVDIQKMQIDYKENTICVTTPKKRKRVA